MDNDIIENATIVPLEELGHEPTDEEIMELFGRVRRSCMRHGHGGPCGQHRPGDAASDPRSAQGRILLLLKSAGTISQRDLRRIVGIRPQSLGELLAKLEAAGYIERTPNESDRRTMDVRITEAGRAVEQRGGSPAMLADLDEQDRRDLYRILAKMAASIEARLAERREECGRGPAGEESPRDWDGCEGHGPHGPGHPHGHHGPHGHAHGCCGHAHGHHGPHGPHGHGCHGYWHGGCGCEDHGGHGHMHGRFGHRGFHGHGGFGYTW